MIRKQFTTEEDFKDFFFGDTVQKEYIYDNVVSSIEIAMFENLDIAVIAEVSVGSEELDIKCQRNEFAVNLQNALIFYEENELYKKCKKVQDLL